MVMMGDGASCSFICFACRLACLRMITPSFKCTDIIRYERTPLLSDQWVPKTGPRCQYKECLRGMSILEPGLHDGQCCLQCIGTWGVYNSLDPPIPQWLVYRSLPNVGKNEQRERGRGRGRIWRFGRASMAWCGKQICTAHVYVQISGELRCMKAPRDAQGNSRQACGESSPLVRWGIVRVSHQRVLLRVTCINNPTTSYFLCSLPPSASCLHTHTDRHIQHSSPHWLILRHHIHDAFYSRPVHSSLSFAGDKFLQLCGRGSRGRRLPAHQSNRWSCQAQGPCRSCRQHPHQSSLSLFCPSYHGLRSWLKHAQVRWLRLQQNRRLWVRRHQGSSCQAPKGRCRGPLVYGRMELWMLPCKYNEAKALPAKEHSFSTRCPDSLVYAHPSLPTCPLFLFN